MRKKTVLVHKLKRAYKNKDNWNYSRSKGYPEGTYFGYSSFNEMKKLVIKKFVDYYGKGLRKWRTRL